MENIVRIEIRGGVPYLITKSKGVKVQIYDHDYAAVETISDKALSQWDSETIVSGDSEVNWGD